MGGSDIGAPVGGAPDDDGAIDETTRHVANLPSVVDDLIPSHGGETPEHQFHHGANSQHAGADAHANESGLGDGGVDDALIAILFPESAGYFISAVVLGDFLAHEHDIGVALDFFGEGLVESVTVVNQWHGDLGKSGKQLKKSELNIAGLSGELGSAVVGSALGARNWLAVRTPPAGGQSLKKCLPVRPASVCRSTS